MPITTYKRYYSSRQPDFTKAKFDYTHKLGRYASVFLIGGSETRVLESMAPGSIFGNFLPNDAGDVYGGVFPATKPGRKGGQERVTWHDQLAVVTGWSPQRNSTGNPIRKNLQRWTAYAIFTPGYSGNNNDPRLFSKDNGTGQNNHTFMFGYTNQFSNQARARIRIGYNGSRASTTLYADSGGPYVDKNTTRPVMIACRYDGERQHVHLLDDSGIHTTNSEPKSGDVYQSTDEVMVGRSAASVTNNIDGWIHSLCFLDGAFLTKDQLEDVFSNPWQMFYESIYVGRAESVGGLSIPIAMHHYKQMQGAN